MTDKPYNKVFVTDSHKYGLLDAYGHLRAVSYNIDGVVLAKHEWRWPDNECSLVKLTFDKTCIRFEKFR